MLTHTLFLALGIAGLYFGAEWLVAGSASLARALGIRPLVVGLTVVAYGTSCPELVVSAAAALGGSSAIAVGNVIGSNIANLGLILGITALVSPPEVDGSLIRREIPVCVGATLLIPFLLFDGSISRIEGAWLVAMALAFTVWVVRTSSAQAPEEAATTPGPEIASSKTASVARAAAGLIVLLVAGKIFVDGAVGLARELGVSERVVGLTIVAIGTSLPEMAASLVAAIRGHSSIAIGNVIGSNIFNVLLILGGASAIRPLGARLADYRLDLAVLIGITLAGAVLLRGTRRVARLEGALLVGTYAAVLAALVVRH